MILIQVLTAMKNKCQLCKFQNWLYFFGVFSSKNLNNRFWQTVVGRHQPGRLGWVFSPCRRDPYLFLAHMPPSHFFQPPNLQLEEVAHKMILPLTSSLIYWLLPRLGRKEPVDTPFLCLWWQNCNNRGEEGSSGWRASPSFSICDLMSVATTCHLSRCFYKKSTSEWAKAADWY